MASDDFVHVNVRVKPGPKRKSRNSSLQIISKDPAIIFSVEKQQTFNFDEVFGEESSQEDIYNVSVKPLVERVKEGYNCTILAYGQTGTGKTYTMGTNPHEENPGIISRVLKDFFTNDDQEEYEVRVSFMEIYNERVFDLLKNDDRVPLLVKGLRVEGLSIERVFNLYEAKHFLEMGSRNRHTGETKQNMFSSRSHAIFSIHFVVNHGERKTAAKLNLVDLAGSESVKKAGTQGNSFQEGININKGLLCIGQVMTALSANLSYIPYRQSVITTILQDSINRNTYISLIACVKAEAQDSSETVQTLEFAQRVKMIRNKPEINEIISKYKTDHPILFARKVSYTPNKRVTKTPFKIRSFKKPRTPPSILSNSYVPSSMCLESSKSVSSLSSNMDNTTFSPVIRKYMSQLENTLMDKIQTVIQNTLKRPSRRSTRVSALGDKENTTKYSWNQIQQKVTKLVQDEVIQLTTKSSRAASSPLDHLEINNAKRQLAYDSPEFEKEESVSKNIIRTKKHSKSGNKSSCISPIVSSFLDGIENFIVNISDSQKNPHMENEVFINDNEISREQFKNETQDSKCKRSDFNFKLPKIPEKIDYQMETTAPRRSTRISMRRESAMYQPETRRSTPYSTQKNANGETCLCNHESFSLPSKKRINSKASENLSPRKAQMRKVLKILNEGDAKQIQKLSTIGPKTAGRIILFRQFKGKFKSIEELENMPGWSNTYFKNFLRQNFLEV